MTDSIYISNHVAAVNGAHIRIPSFWPAKVELWFRQLEVQFGMANSFKDELKFGHVRQFNQRSLEEVEDII
jgi:hypothetical protein